MDSDFTMRTLALAATYWVHSTVLLGGVWALLKWRKDCGYVVRERLWKFAAVGGFVTAGVQAATGFGIPVFGSSVVETAVASEPQALDSGTGQPSLSVNQSLAMVRESFIELREASVEPVTESGELTAARRKSG